MQDIIEILFEEVNLNKVSVLLANTCSTAQFTNYLVSTDDSGVCDINFKSQDQIFTFIGNSSDGAFYFNFSEFQLNEFEFSSIGFQIYKYDKKYDLNLHIPENEIIGKITIVALQSWADIIAKSLIAKEYFCGYEPASDQATRFFSGSILGPLKD